MRGLYAPRRIVPGRCSNARTRDVFPAAGSGSDPEFEDHLIWVALQEGGDGTWELVGYEATREAAMAAFAKSWQRE